MVGLIWLIGLGRIIALVFSMSTGVFLLVAFGLIVLLLRLITLLFGLITLLPGLITLLLGLIALLLRLIAFLLGLITLLFGLIALLFRLIALLLRLFSLLLSIVLRFGFSLRALAGLLLLYRLVGVSFFLFLAVVASSVALSSVFAFTVTVEASQAFLFQQVDWFLWFCVPCLFGQTVGLDAPFVQADDFKCTPSTDGHQIGWDALIGRVGYLIAQNVRLEEVEYAVFGFQFNLFGRQALLCLYVAIHFVVEAAFQFGALSCQLLRVE